MLLSSDAALPKTIQEQYSYLFFISSKDTYVKVNVTCIQGSGNNTSLSHRSCYLTQLPDAIVQGNAFSFVMY
jgi:hypothetical protein